MNVYNKKRRRRRRRRRSRRRERNRWWRRRRGRSGSWNRCLPRFVVWLFGLGLKKQRANLLRNSQAKRADDAMQQKKKRGRRKQNQKQQQQQLKQLEAQQKLEWKLKLELCRDRDCGTWPHSNGFLCVCSLSLSLFLTLCLPLSPPTFLPPLSLVDPFSLLPRCLLHLFSFWFASVH